MIGMERETQRERVNGLPEIEDQFLHARQEKVLHPLTFHTNYFNYITYVYDSDFSQSESCSSPF